MTEPFTPVPVRARHDGWTPARQRAFVEQLGRCGAVGHAARAVGMSAKSAYRLRARADAVAFAAAWDAALAVGVEQTLEHAFARLADVQYKPYFYRGLQRGRIPVDDTRLLLAMLRVIAQTPRLTDVPPGIPGPL